MSSWSISNYIKATEYTLRTLKLHIITLFVKYMFFRPKPSVNCDVCTLYSTVLPDSYKRFIAQYSQGERLGFGALALRSALYEL